MAFAVSADRPDVGSGPIRHDVHRAPDVGDLVPIGGNLDVRSHLELENVGVQKFRGIRGGMVVGERRQSERRGRGKDQKASQHCEIPDRSEQKWSKDP